MYRQEDMNQLKFENFYLPFGDKIRRDYRWVILAQQIPWQQIEGYRQRLGFYPELVHVDKLYRTRANRQYCQARGIRLAGVPQALYDDIYCQRGDMENRIKEQQLGLFADRTSCHDFGANQFRVLLSAAAYVLLETLRRIGLAGTELAAAQISTIRRKLLKIGAGVICSVRRIVLHLAGGYPLQQLFASVLARLSPTVAGAVPTG